MGLGNRRIWSIEEEKRSFLKAREHYRAILERNDIPQHAIEEWEHRELKALEEGVAFNFFPQFYALGGSPRAGHKYNCDKRPQGLSPFPPSSFVAPVVWVERCDHDTHTHTRLVEGWLLG